MMLIGEFVKGLAILTIILLAINTVDDDQLINGNNGGNEEGGTDNRMIHTCPMYAKIRWLLVESRGGPIRSRILLLLRERPTNINRIARELNMDYKTVKHHLELLEENGLVKRLGLRYGDVYFIEDNAYRHWNELYELIKESLKLSDSPNPQQQRQIENHQY